MEFVNGLSAFTHLYDIILYFTIDGSARAKMCQSIWSKRLTRYFFGTRPRTLRNYFIFFNLTLIQFNGIITIDGAFIESWYGETGAFKRIILWVIVKM